MVVISVCVLSSIGGHPVSMHPKTPSIVLILKYIASKLISQIASYCIHFARCKSPIGSNILFCADRYQTNIDDILSGSSNYTVHSHYNRSIADVQLRASSFLSELVSIRDSRQSFFIASLSPKRN